MDLKITIVSFIILEVVLVHYAVSQTTNNPQEMIQINETIDNNNNVNKTDTTNDELKTLNKTNYYHFGVYNVGEFGYEVMKDLEKFVNKTQQGFEAFDGLYYAQFQLFTRSNLNAYQIVSKQNIASSNFDPTRDTMFVIHGWVQDGSNLNIINIKDAILSAWNMNVIIVDWGELAGKFYNVARFGIDSIATDVADLMKHVSQNLGQPMDSIHAAGFSLGAHIAGLAGKMLGGRIGYIYGIDPAFPLFNIWNTNDRLNIGDARYVQVIHTTGDQLGFMHPLGDYDVYPNGGRRQPRCPLEIFPMCSHSISQIYFANAVRNPTTYSSVQCSNFWQIVVGYCTPVGKRAPFITIKPTTKYRGVFWSRIA